MKISEFCVHRRAILAAIPGVVLLPAAVSACSSDSSSSSKTTSQDSPADQMAPMSSGAPGSRTLPVSQVPVGHAVIVSGDNPVVVAQPTAGKFVGFSAVCTHQGVTVAVTEGLQLKCPAHGSEYNAATGAVERGPAPKPLPSVMVMESGGTLTIS